MGNTRDASEADYALYGRPKNADGGVLPSQPAHAAAGGSGPRPDEARSGDPAGTQAAGEGRGSAVPGGSSPDENPQRHQNPPRRRFNPYLWAAWVLVALMLATGVTWLTGALEPSRYADYLGEGGQETGFLQGAVAMNLYSMGPFLLLFGLMGAFTLLTVQAAAYRRRPAR